MSTEELQDRLSTHLHQLVRERDPVCAPAGHSHVEGYVGQELARYGHIVRHGFSHGGRAHENLVLDLPGQDDRGFVLVVAHYDAVPGSPGDPVPAHVLHRPELAEGHRVDRPALVPHAEAARLVADDPASEHRVPCSLEKRFAASWTTHAGCSP